ncbi:leucine-rich repeat domain-containing protein [Lacticaseibacillus saniviri]
MFKQNAKTHYKMYKGGKFWLFSLTLIAGLTGAYTGTQNHVAAATNDTEPATGTTSQASPAAASQTLHVADDAAKPQGTADTAVTQQSATSNASTAQAAPANESAAQSQRTTVATGQPANTITQAPVVTQAAASETAPQVQTDASPKGQTTATERTPIQQQTNAIKATTQAESPAVVKAAKSVTPAAQAAVTAPTTTPQATESINDWMPNTKLQNLVLLMLQKQGKGKTWNSVNDITQADMQQLTAVDNYWDVSWNQNYDTFIDGKTSYSLEGLQYATNLKDLILRMNLNAPGYTYYGDITDLTPIQNLTNLEDVELSGNRISDISPLKNLKKVTYLNLQYNEISDWSPLNVSQYTGATTYPINTDPATSGQIDPTVTSNGTIRQLVVLPPVYLPAGTNTYTLDSPITLPDGTKGKLSTYTGGGEVVIIHNTATGAPGLVQLFYNGAPSSVQDGNGLTFTIATKQDWTLYQYQLHYNNIPVLQHDWPYYMIARYYASGQNVNPVATIMVPYVTGQQPTVTGSDVTIHVGDAMPDASQFNPKATDITGKEQPASDITVSMGNADNMTPGDYPIVISVPKTATHPSDYQTTVYLHVLPNQQTLTGSDYTMYVGDPTPTADNFQAKATDIDGKDESKDVTVDLTGADLSKPGDYPVILKTPDGQSKTVTLHVLENKQSISGSDYTMHVGDPTPTADNFQANATDKDGNKLDVNVDLSQADLKTPGDYPVTLTTSDGQKKTVILHVLPAETNPGNPGEPSDPGNPSEPSNPGNPSNPSNPGNPSEPSNPGNPSNPSNPGNPSEPSNPSNPSTPEQPGLPGTGGNHGQEPSQPTKPAQPAKPNQPTQPNLPGTGGNGGQQPVQPNVPKQPVHPGVTATPSATQQQTGLTSVVSRPVSAIHQAQSALPQTNEKQQSRLVVLGLIASVIGSLGLWVTFKKH